MYIIQIEEGEKYCEHLTYELEQQRGVEKIENTLRKGLVKRTREVYGSTFELLYSAATRRSMMTGNYNSQRSAFMSSTQLATHCVKRERRMELNTTYKQTIGEWNALIPKIPSTYKIAVPTNELVRRSTNEQEVTHS